jgi:hypothetical protein
VEQGGGIVEASWPPRLIFTPPATTVGLAVDVARCQQRRGGGQPRPQSLPGCPAKPPASSPAQIRATREERGGRWVGGNCRGPMASQAATHALPPLPPSARPSDVHCDASAIHMHVRCARAPPPTVALTTSRCRPAGSTHGGHGFIIGAMDFTTIREKRGGGEGATETTRPPRLPPAPYH